MSGELSSGYAPVDGMHMYWQSRGRGGPAVVVVHGGFGGVSSVGALVDELARSRRVVAVELQGHGHTGDVDRPFGYRAFGDDVAAVVDHLGLGQVDLVGYSLGAGACLRAAIQHPDVVRKLVAVSFPAWRDGWFPEVRTAFDHMGSGLFETMRHSPLYAAWREAAPDPDAFPTVMDKMGELQRQPYDWREELRGVGAPTLLVFGDADSVPVSHMAEFYALLGGGLRDAGWDGDGRSAACLAVLPGQTHYDVVGSEPFLEVLRRFLDEGRTDAARDSEGDLA